MIRIKAQNKINTFWLKFTLSAGSGDIESCGFVYISVQVLTVSYFDIARVSFYNSFIYFFFCYDDDDSKNIFNKSGKPKKKIYNVKRYKVTIKANV